MKVILRADVAELGKRGDVLDVADGFARNFLIPSGKAMRASEGAQSQAAAMRRARDVKDSTNRAAAQEIATKLVPTVITVQAKAGTGDRLFGSVTAGDVVDAVAAQTGITIDRKDLHLDEHIKTLGTHMVTANLHPEVQFPITIEVEAIA